MNDIKNALRNFILTEVLVGEDPANLTDDTELRDSGILDSLSTLKLVSFLETQYKIEFEASDLAPANLVNINTIERLVNTKL
jgi:acyl carrier protein